MKKHCSSLRRHEKALFFPQAMKKHCSSLRRHEKALFFPQAP
jgi:hypothetical protein